jgi:hypothetical protein
MEVPHQAALLTASAVEVTAVVEAMVVGLMVVAGTEAAAMAVPAAVTAVVASVAEPVVFANLVSTEAAALVVWVRVCEALPGTWESFHLLRRTFTWSIPILQSDPMRKWLNGDAEQKSLSQVPASQTRHIVRRVSVSRVCA